jgi:hypothetical protein
MRLLTVATRGVREGEGHVTIIPERRGDTDIIFLFVGGVFLAGSVRGLWSGEVLAVVGLAISAAVLGTWIYMRMTPRFALTIGPDEIVFGRPNERRAVIARAATAGVLIKQDGGSSPWFLVAGDGDDPVEGTTVPLLGFDPGAIANACEANGWPVTMNPPLHR